MSTATIHHLTGLFADRSKSKPPFNIDESEQQYMEMLAQAGINNDLSEVEYLGVCTRIADKGNVIAMEILGHLHTEGQYSFYNASLAEEYRDPELGIRYMLMAAERAGTISLYKDLAAFIQKGNAKCAADPLGALQIMLAAMAISEDTNTPGEFDDLYPFLVHPDVRGALVAQAREVGEHIRGSLPVLPPSPQADLF